ncbi:MAG: hypothetical protein P8H13_05330 [Polaribacter sp.]|nr:hypothetical protein [Polaribacter sp.]MDG1811340.1 hypothetical protein [Polaribacter sp.]MDG1993739.1 hypothetical protein [Polaribacter sp.]
MIRFVNRNQIDVEKYNYCIEKAIQSRIYAYAWYLDIVADNWSVLVLDDYDAVMPLPWKIKYGIKYITQPFFTQQLGFFSAEEISEKEIEEFIKNIPKKFLKISLQLNSENRFLNKKLIKKNNYILTLDKEYSSLYKGFSKGRKHAVNQGEKQNFSIDDILFSELLILSKENYSFNEIRANEYLKLSKLVSVLKSKGKARILGVKSKNQLIGGAVFLFDYKRIIYLFSAVSSEGKEKNVASLLLNSLIKEFSNTARILDFEGSQISGIATFFKSFGAEKETYFLLRRPLL